LTVTEVSRNLHKIVRFVNSRTYIDNTYLLSDLRIDGTDGKIRYRCVLTDLCINNSVLVCRPEDLREIETG
jgi:hypothetical protein